jgi:hypothetical protein
MKKDKKQRLFEVMSRLDKTFKPNLNEDITNIDKRENLEYFLSFNNDDIYWKWVNDEISDNNAIQIIRDIDGIEYNPNIDYKKEYSSMSENIFKDDSATSKMFRDTAKAFDPKGYEERLKKERPNQTEPEVKPKAMNQFKKDLNERKPADINPKYTHFALLKDSKKFVNGWDFKDVDPEDLKQDKMHYFFQDIIDMDINPKNVLIGTVKKFQKEGLDPFDSNNWYKFNADGWQEKDNLKEIYPSTFNTLTSKRGTPEYDEEMKKHYEKYGHKSDDSANIKQIIFKYGDVSDMIVEFNDGSKEEFEPGLPTEIGSNEVIRMNGNEFNMPYYSHKTKRILLFSGKLKITSFK